VSKLINFFSSFDKLMKEKLVKAFYWLVLLNIILVFLIILFEVIRLDPLAALFSFILYFVSFVTLIVGLRLACELAIALFRINDNLSPDGGKSETADIDPLEEARRAAEAAAKRAREATRSTYEKTSAATKSTFDKTSFTNHDNPTPSKPGPNPARTPNTTSKSVAVQAEPIKTAPASKTTAKKKTPTVKKTTAVKADSKKKTPTQKSSSVTVKYNKDGSVRKKPGPKIGSSSKYTKHGRLKKKPGPKPKS